MRKSTCSIDRLILRRSLPVLFSIFGTVVFAQNAKQVAEIRKESNLKNVSTFQKNLEAISPSAQVIARKAKALNIPVEGEAKGQRFQLVRFDKRGLPVYYISSNVGAAAGTQTTKLNSTGGMFNLDGQNITLYEWDGGGVRVSHQEFEGRANQGDFAFQTLDHSTHVAGTMIAAGINPKAKGMAPKANLTAYDWNSDLQEMLDAATNDGALLSNHSYGEVAGFTYGNYGGATGWYFFGNEGDKEDARYGKYTETDQNIDHIADIAPYYLPVKAAGNPRGDGPRAGESYYIRDENGEWVVTKEPRPVNGGSGGFDTVGPGNLPKNGLVVAASEKLNGEYKSPEDVKVAYFSGFGPTDDGRIKPDITGIGVDIFSTVDSADDAYDVESGTSMASPNVTGTLGLLQQHYSELNGGTFMKSATVKALVAATANEAGNIGPDYKYGWGLLNAFKAAETISANGKLSFIKQNRLSNGETNTLSVTATGNEPLVVTIAWTDPATADADLTDYDAVNDRKPMLVNDLDVRVTKEGETYNPWVLDPTNPNNPATKGDNIVDNIEQVVIENPVAGATYEIAISHKGTLKKTKISDKGEFLLENADTQDYSIVVAGINNNVQNDLGNLSVEPGVDLKEFSNETPIVATFQNNGTSTASGAQLKYTLKDSDSQKVLKSGSVALPSLAPGEKKEATFNLDLRKVYVNYQINTEIVYDLDELADNNKVNTNVFSVMADLTEKDSAFYFGFEEDFRKYAWISEDIDKDGRSWFQYPDASLARTDVSFATNFPAGNAADDWLFSNPLKMKADGHYRVIYYQAKLRDEEEILNVKMGKEAKASAMTMEVAENIAAHGSGNYERHIFELHPTEDGVYYIGFQNFNPAGKESYAVFVDDFGVENTQKPFVDIKASTENPSTYDIVEFSPDIYTGDDAPITKYEWAFDPTTMSFEEGTNANSKNPKVKFAKEGTYTVSLSATNQYGESSIRKEGFITVENIPVKADFAADKQTVFLDGKVHLKSTGIGNPSPHAWKWEVLPADGVQFVENTTASSERPVVQFNELGNYTVQLTATSDISSNTRIKSNYITVKELNTVRNLTGTGDKNKDVQLQWMRPILQPIFFEDFEANQVSVSVYKDEDGDGRNWILGDYNPIDGLQSLISESWTMAGGFLDVNNWIGTMPGGKGAEELSFDIKHEYPEAYDVRIIKSTDIAGDVPTMAEVLAAPILYDHTQKEAQVEPKTMRMDISAYTADSDVMVIFHHKTTKDYEGYILYLDDFALGYKNVDDNGNPVTKSSTKTENKDVVAKISDQGQNVLTRKLHPRIDMSKYIKPMSIKMTNSIEKYNPEVPSLTGYEVYRDEQLVKELSGINNTNYDETVPEVKKYTYDVVAKYGSISSQKETVIVDLSTLGTTDLKTDNGLVVYPNPSSGNFQIKGYTEARSLDLKVFDMTGKLILSKKSQSNESGIDLTRFGKGMYILQVVDNNGKKNQVKLIVQ